jgi:ankyrin repeat protein
MWATIRTIRARDNEAVEMLFDMNRIGPNLSDPRYGRAPLLWVTIDGHKDIVEMLLNSVDTRHGRTPSDVNHSCP